MDVLWFCWTCCEWLLLYEPITMQQIGLKRSFLWRGAQIIGSEKNTLNLKKHIFETPWGISRTREPMEDPITEKPKDEPKQYSLSWRPWGRPWKRLVELKADLAKQFLQKKYWDKKQILRQYESMTGIIYFFQMMMPFLAYVVTFSKQLHFRRIYFFTVSTSSEQLKFKSNYLDLTVTFFK